MASLQARHSQTCKFDWTRFEFPTGECTCNRGPTYYVCDPRLQKQKVKAGKNRKVGPD